MWLLGGLVRVVLAVLGVQRDQRRLVEFQIEIWTERMLTEDSLQVKKMIRSRQNLLENDKYKEHLLKVTLT